MKVSLDGRAPELTWGNNQKISGKSCLINDILVYRPGHGGQHYNVSASEGTCPNMP